MQVKVKHTLALLLALVLSFSLVACNTDDPSKKDKPEQTTLAAENKDKEKTSEKETEAPAETTEAEKKETEKEAEKETEDKQVFAGRQLNVVTTSEKYKELFDRFSAKTGAKVEFLSMSSGEVFSRVKAEGDSVSLDVWFGGGLDAFLAAKEDGLLEQYKPAGIEDIRADYRDSDNYWLSKGITVAGFIVNNDILEEKGLDMPASWEDLAKEEYKDEVIMSNPAISGTNYAVIKGLLDQYGEEKGWELIEKINANISFYGKRGKDPQEKTVAGEFAIGIIPADKSAFDAAEEHNCTVVYPDAIPWVPEGVAIFKNAENLDVAKAFIDFMLEDDNLQLLAELDGKDPAQMVKPGLKGAELGLPEDKLIKEDLTTFGSERDAILEKFLEIAGDKAESKD